MRLFLASESPRRHELLKALAEKFTVEAAQVQEVAAESGCPVEELVRTNAVRKAHAVAALHPEDWVLGADTVVELDGKVYGKPRDLAEAAEVLRTFSGRTHRVITAIALMNKAQSQQSVIAETSFVKFRELSDQDIAYYLSQVPVLDKAGSYGIQEHGELLVEGIEGELENIIGLPVKALAEEMKKMGISGKF